jgi:hypothetical protein
MEKNRLIFIKNLSKSFILLIILIIIYCIIFICVMISSYNVQWADDDEYDTL